MLLTAPFHSLKQLLGGDEEIKRLQDAFDKAKERVRLAATDDEKVWYGMVSRLTEQQLFFSRKIDTIYFFSLICRKCTQIIF